MRAWHTGIRGYRGAGALQGSGDGEAFRGRATTPQHDALACFSSALAQGFPPSRRTVRAGGGECDAACVRARDSPVPSLPEERSVAHGSAPQRPVKAQVVVAVQQLWAASAPVGKARREVVRRRGAKRREDAVGADQVCKVELSVCYGGELSGG